MDRSPPSCTVLDRPMTNKSRILCDLVPKTNTEEVPNEEVPTRYLAAVPMSKFLLWEIVWPQRKRENSQRAHAHYGALRVGLRSYSPVIGVRVADTRLTCVAIFCAQD